MTECKHQEIAHAIEAVCAGHKSVDVLIAISIVLGAFEAKAKRPDLDGLMRLVHATAKQTFNMILEERDG